MPRFIVSRQWLQLSDEKRSCGTCYACCTWLGINELKKWGGQNCKHLDGSNPHGRCSIYAKRPAACSAYSCAWLEGFGDEDLKPEKSGLLITLYAPHEEKTWGELKLGSTPSATVIVFDQDKAQSHLNQVLVDLLAMNLEVRFVNYKTKAAVLYKDGKIYKCHILKPDEYESLVFEAEFPPTGTYELKGEEDAGSL